MMKLGGVKLLPYYLPGDPAMGAAVRGLAGKRSAVCSPTTGRSSPERTSTPPSTR